MAAVREVAERVEPDVALANHLVMGPVILARGLGGRVPYAVKVHGSALEYTVRPEPERFLPYALEGLRGAGGVLVGSRHTAESLWEVTGEPGLPERTRLGPPGVDVESFRPAARRRGGRGAERGWRSGSRGARRPHGAARRAPRTRCGRSTRRRDRIVAFVGKLIVSKGVDLLLAAWPLVLAEVPDGPAGGRGLRRVPRRPAAAGSRRWRSGDLEDAREVAAAGARARGRPARRAAPPGGLPRRPRGRAPGEYLKAAAGIGRARALHRPARARGPAGPAARLRGAGHAQHVPRGVRHGGRRGAPPAARCRSRRPTPGMAEVTATLAPALEEPLRPLLSFEVGPEAVEQIAAKLVRWLGLDAGGARAGPRGAGRAGAAPLLAGRAWPRA